MMDEAEKERNKRQINSLTFVNLFFNLANSVLKALEEKYFEETIKVFHI